jgi:thiol-disulfide isomerase/thioredoxin
VLRKLAFAVALSLVGGGACTRIGVARADCKNSEETCRPEISGTSLDGKWIGESALKDKIVLVNFWASWCHPCAEEIPALDAVYRRHKDQGFVVLGMLAKDRASDDQVRQFVTDKKASYPILRSDRDLQDRFGLADGLPMSVLYDRSGRVVGRWLGGITEDVLEESVKKLVP